MGRSSPVAIAKILRGQVANELNTAEGWAEVRVNVHGLRRTEPSRHTVDLHHPSAHHGERQPNVAHALRTCCPLAPGALIEPLLVPQGLAIHIRELDEQRGLVKIPFGKLVPTLWLTHGEPPFEYPAP